MTKTGLPRKSASDARPPSSVSPATPSSAAGAGSVAALSGPPDVPHAAVASASAMRASRRTMPERLPALRKVGAVIAGGEVAAGIRRALSPTIVAVALTALAGVVLRVWAYRATIGTPNGDEAVMGLMTRHFLDGELSTFYWGQSYGGTQEVLLTVPVFLLTGTSWLGLRIVPIVLSAVAALLVWRVGRRLFGEPAGTVAGLVFWIWPGFNIFWLTHQQGFYASNVVYCALLLLLALRVAERPDALRVGAFGLVLGLAFWQTAQIVPVAAGIVLWTVWKAPRALRRLHVAVPLAVLGALPWIVWNVTHEWESLHQPEYGDKLQSIRLLASPVLPMIVGLRAPLSAELLLPPAALTYLVYVVLVAAFVYGFVTSIRRDVSILYVVVLVFPVVWALSPKTSLALGTPRFVVALTPVLALLLAQLATGWRRGAAILALALVVSVVTLQRTEQWFSDTPRETTHAEGLGPRHTVQWVPRDLGPLVERLDELGLSRVYAEYWLAYRLNFDTEERIIAAHNAFVEVTVEDGQAVPTTLDRDRYPPYTDEVREARHGFVFYRQYIDTIPIVPDLERLGYRRHDVANFAVYAPPARITP